MSQRMWMLLRMKSRSMQLWIGEEALKDADFVTTQFRVGQLDARIKDERIPSYYGMIGQETNGAGGIFKAFVPFQWFWQSLRHEAFMSKCLVINFANPSGMVTEAVIRYGKWDKVIGLCNVPVMATMTEPAMLGKKKRRADLQVCRSKSLPLAQSSR